MRRSARAAVLAAAALGTPALQAEIVDIAWRADGRFERQLAVEPGRFAEVCGRLARAEAVSWRFEASGPLNFNIHYHEGKDVHYPERRDALAAGSGQLRPALYQDYCWMWSNKGPRAVELKLQLQR